MRPSFVVIGAAKSGTSSLCHLLGQHREIFMSPRKELHHFSFDEVFARGVEQYERWFDGARETQQVGEGSTSYTVRKLFPRTAERLAAYEPELKLIFIAREPIARMESVWMQLRWLSAMHRFREVGVSSLPDAMWVDLSFNRAVRLQSDVIVESTNYRKELDVYREFFDDEQILVLLFEQLERDPASVLRRCFEFLGVDPEGSLPERGVHLNSADERRVPRAVLRRLWSSDRIRRASAWAGDALPLSVRSPLSRRFLRVPAVRPRWEAETLAWAMERLRDDLEWFLEFYDYPRAAWDRSMCSS